MYQCLLHLDRIVLCTAPWVAFVKELILRFTHYLYMQMLCLLENYWPNYATGGNSYAIDG